MDFRRGHRVTGEFRRSQIVTPVAAECIAHMGVTTPCAQTETVGVQSRCTSKRTVGVTLHLEESRIASKRRRRG